MASSPELPPHPPALLEADRPYLAPWGRGTIRRLGTFTTGVAGVVIVVASFSEVWAFLFLLAPLLFNFASGILFFRNPGREVPAAPGILVSPADGKVVEATRVEEAEYIGGPALKVAIFLSVFDVHVNRAPGAGRVEYLRHRPGAYHDARSAACALENESLSIGCVLEQTETPRERRLLIRKISGAIARRIICPLAVGDRVRRGGLVGMIRYGSRAEVFLEIDGDGDDPAAWEIAVRPGDRVLGGESILFRRSPDARSPGGDA